MMTVEEIRRKKQEIGYSTEQLATLAGIPVGTLQKILNGQTKTPRYATLQALEKVLKLAPTGMIHEASAAYSAGTEFVKTKTPGEFTISDYYALPDDQRVELIDGVIYDMGAPTYVHQKIIGKFFFQVEKYIDFHKGKCDAMTSPIDVRLDEDDKTMVQPDALILCDHSKIRSWGICGAPDFILEIVSKSSSHRDYILKAGKYMKAGVREYWIINPEKKTLVIHRRTETDKGNEVYIGSLSGTHGIGIYNNDLVINLDQLAALIQNYPKEK